MVRSEIKKLTIGNVELSNNVVLAPMAGVSDIAFRLLCHEQGAGLVCSEMVSAKAILYGNKNTEELLQIHPGEGAVSLQLFGSDPDIVSEMAIKKPLTVKIRKGFDDGHVNAVEMAHILQESGAAAVAVHGRTREQYYSGQADWDIIAQVKAAVKIPVIGNGDVTDADSALRLLEKTGCDGVMIGRGAQGNPWIFREVTAALEGREIPLHPTRQELYDMIARHAHLAAEYKGEYITVREMRKHLAWYTTGLPHAAALRRQINHMETMEGLLEGMHHLLLEEPELSKE